MERLNATQWINDLKIAIINEDMNKIEEYSKRDIPKFTSIKEAKEALSLINKVTSNLSAKKIDLSKQMQSIKQAKKYITSYSKNSTNDWKA